jgi:hypothetical protein
MMLISGGNKIQTRHPIPIPINVSIIIARITFCLRVPMIYSIQVIFHHFQL